MSIKRGMDRQTGRWITGKPYLRQRLADVINTPLGSLPGARQYGSQLYQLVDHNVGPDFYMSAYEYLADAINHPVNGLDDFQLQTMLIARIAPHHYEISITGTYLINGEPVTFDGIELHVEPLT